MPGGSEARPAERHARRAELNAQFREFAAEHQGRAVHTAPLAELAARAGGEARRADAIAARAVNTSTAETRLPDTMARAGGFSP